MSGAVPRLAFDGTWRPKTADGLGAGLTVLIVAMAACLAPVSTAHG